MRLKEEKIKELQKMLHTQSPVKTQVKYFVSFPSNEAHSGHPIGQEAVHSQKVHPRVAQKIMEMVTSGMTDTADVRRSLKYILRRQLSLQGTLPFTIDHLEIAHSRIGDHYDSVVPYSKNSLPLQAPKITPRVVASINLK